MPLSEKELEILASRENQVYSIRKPNLLTNILGWHGGKEYVLARLSRFPGESTYEWDGGTRTDGSKFDGRKDVSHVIPYLNRIVTKINQYVFGQAPKREGVDADIQSDISLTGESINELMSEINSYLTVCGWAWIGIDAPVIDMGLQLSQAEKETLKVRPYWCSYSPLQVVDWHFAKDGELEWVITEGFDYVANDPIKAPVNVKYRKLWEKGRVTKFFYKNDSNKIERTEVYNLSYTDKVPFVLVGKISPEPYAFDNLESINKTIMDLESCNRQNFYNSVFPQLKLPVSVLDNVTQKFNVTAEQAVTMICGLQYPILMSENDKDPGYIMPDASAIGTMREELGKLKQELFLSTGLMLQQDTRQVASAESKAWDYLDITMVIKERARILQEAEEKAIIISNAWDSDFPAYTVQYNTDFAIGNFKQDMEALILANGVQTTPELKKLIAKRIFELIKQNGSSIDANVEQVILDSIESIKELEPIIQPDVLAMSDKTQTEEVNRELHE